MAELWEKEAQEKALSEQHEELLADLREKGARERADLIAKIFVDGRARWDAKENWWYPERDPLLRPGELHDLGDVVRDSRRGQDAWAKKHGPPRTNRYKYRASNGGSDVEISRAPGG